MTVDTGSPSLAVEASVVTIVKAVAVVEVGAVVVDGEVAAVVVSLKAAVLKFPELEDREEEVGKDFSPLFELRNLSSTSSSSTSSSSLSSATRGEAFGTSASS